MKKNRKSIRLQDYDYSSAGYYFVTVCVAGMKEILWEIRRGTACCALNQYGKIVEEELLRTETKRENVRIDEYVIMPNHVHMIIEICRGVLQYARTNKNDNNIDKNRFKSPSQTLGAIIRGIKSASTKKINQLRNTPGTTLWHRNYYEHIIRTEKDLFRIRKYIQGNPANWKNDEYNSHGGV